MKEPKTEGTEMTPAAPDAVEKRRKKRREGGFALLLTQSVIVVVILLVGWLFRAIGGGAFEQLRTQLAAALTDNTFVESVLSLWVPSQETTEKSDSQDGVQADFTAAGAIPAASVYLKATKAGVLCDVSQSLGDRYGR